LTEEILQACMELVDDAKKSCADLVFKEVCLEILSKARHVLSERKFKQLTTYASSKMQEKIPFDLQYRLMARG